MRVGTKGVLKNFSYSFFANIISLSVSIAMVTFVPKYLSLESYGMWQLFLFYFSYLGFFHFGWEDGIYLRYAGEKFDSLDKKKFAGQFYALMFLQILITGSLILYSFNCVFEPARREVLILTAFLIPLVNFNGLCNFIMRITNRIKVYALLMIVERIVLLVMVFGVIISENHSFFYLYVSKVLSLTCVFIVEIYFCRYLLKPTFNSLSSILSEAKKNLSVGSKLMLANIASMLIIGIVRYGISEGWSIITFGKVSLTLGISNFLMIFINSLSVVFFPILKHLDERRLSEVYMRIRNILTVILFAALMFYYPLQRIVAWWLPKYTDSLIYMSILFPVCLFESKVSLLINTYLQSMRQEKMMLKINVCVVMISVIMTIASVKIVHNLTFAVVSIVVLYGLRCIIAEYCLGKLLKLSLLELIVADVVMVIIFMLSGWFIDSYLCTLMYLIAYIFYLWRYKERLLDFKILMNKFYR